MPPVLYVALLELPRRRAQQVLARQLGPAVNQGHDVLELVAKAVGAARLIIRRARPEPATQRLVQQPAIDEQIERAVGRRDLDGAEYLVPLPGRALAGPRDLLWM